MPVTTCWGSALMLGVGCVTEVHSALGACVRECCAASDNDNVRLITCTGQAYVQSADNMCCSFVLQLSLT